MTAYSLAGQFGAGDGYAVFYPNYRGSTGRGVDFAKEHQNDYAGAEFNDLVDGVDALAEAGIINEDRVGITGGSAASRLDYAYRLMRWMDTYLDADANRDDEMPEFDIGISEKLGWDDGKEETPSKK